MIIRLSLTVSSLTTSITTPRLFTHFPWAEYAETHRDIDAVKILPVDCFLYEPLHE